MKKVIAVTLPLLVALAVIVPVIISQAGFSPLAQAALDHYLDYKKQGLSVVALDRAGQPWNFTREMSALAIGESARYWTIDPKLPGNAVLVSLALETLPPQLPPNDSQTPQPYPPSDTEQQVTAALTPQAEGTLPPQLPLNDGRIPLPFPPTDAWCVALESNGATFHVVVSFHQDLYNGAWIVHELKDSQALPVIGCNSA